MRIKLNIVFCLIEQGNPTELPELTILEIKEYNFVNSIK